MSCSTVLQVAQFSPNTVEAETNATTFDSENGSIVMYGNINGLDEFYL